MNLTILIARVIVQWRRPWFLFMVLMYGVLFPLALTLSPTAATVKQSIPQPYYLLILAIYIQQAIPTETDGYLLLVFSRPLTRSSYMLSRWATNAFSMIVICTLSLCVFDMVPTLEMCPVPDSYILWNIFINCMEYAAVAQFYNQLRPFGQFIFATALAIVVGIGQLATLLTTGTGMTKVEYMEQAASSAQGFSSMLTANCNTYEALNRLNPDWSPLVIALSNTAIFLLLSACVVNGRELSYAEE